MFDDWHIQKTDILFLSSDNSSKQSVKGDVCNVVLFVSTAEESLYISTAYSSELKMAFAQFLYCQNL